MTDKLKNRPRVFLNAKEEKEIQQGFPWGFDNEISLVDGVPLSETKLDDGSIVDVFSKGGIFLGSGVFNKKSKITIRILSREKYTEYNYEFFLNRVRAAYELRFLFRSYVDSEDRVFLVVQFLALAVEIFRNEILRALSEVCHPFAIYERSDVDVREKEDLPIVKGWIGSDFCTHDSSVHNSVITIKENGVLLEVDIENGQKTGYFLDQKFNRRHVAQLAQGKTVLDTFTHTGAFGLNAFMGGAKKVVSVDISPEAVEKVKTNIKLNHAEKVMSVVCADVFDFLKAEETRLADSENEKYDIIILDPPAFAKSAKSIEKAYGGYKEINMKAMKILKKGGILVSCSCSHFMEESMFLDMMMHASRDVGKKIQVLEKRGAGSDHPVLLGYPKSQYLKCVIARVL